MSSLYFGSWSCCVLKDFQRCVEGCRDVIELSYGKPTSRKGPVCRHKEERPLFPHRISSFFSCIVTVFVDR